MSKPFLAAGLKLYNAKRNDEDVTNIIINYARNTYNTPSTLKSSLSRLKALIISTHYADITQDVPPAVLSMVLTKNEYESINKDSKKKLEQRANNIIVINNGSVFLDKMLAGLTSDTFPELYTALLLATGRRSSEVLHTIKLTPDKDSAYSAIFSGAIKTGLNEALPFAIPLLANYKLVSEALDKLRVLLTAHKAHDYPTTLNRYVVRVTGDKRLHPHSLRGLYATYNYMIRNPNQSENAYFAEILGHSDMTSSLSYNVYKIINFE